MGRTELHLAESDVLGSMFKRFGVAPVGTYVCYCALGADDVSDAALETIKKLRLIAP